MSLPCWATQDGWVMMESSDKTWSTGEGNGKPHQHSYIPFMYEKAKRYDTERWTPRKVGAQYANGEQWRNNSRMSEKMEPKWKQDPVVDVTGDGTKVWCCKKWYSIGTWNVSSMNTGKLEAVTQEMARVNINILGISELQWTEMDEI